MPTDHHDDDLDAEIDARIAALPSGPPLPFRRANGHPKGAPPPIDPTWTLVDDDDVATNDRILSALARSADLYEHAGVGRIVEVLASDRPSVLRRDADAPRLHTLVAARLGELISAHCDLRQERRGKGGAVSFVRARAPRAPSQILARGRWPQLRRLRGVVSGPIFRGDGSIAATPGYDPATEVLIDVPASLRVRVAERPTRDDAREAARELLDLLVDFPIISSGRSAWLALVLTIVARDAIDGCVPAFLVDANSPASGKGLLVGTAGTITLGRQPAAAAWDDDAAEQRKLIMSLALEAERVVAIDNVRDVLRSPSLERALTARSVSDRLLGTQTVVTAPFDSIVAITANNCRIGGDLWRRIVPMRLVTEVERPDLRGDFRHPDLLAHARERRGELASAALTILRGFHCAGRPPQGLSEMGSFREWSSLVRDAIAWCDLPDPLGDREALRLRSDDDLEMAAALLSAWREHCSLRDDGITIAAAIRDVHATVTDPDALERRAELRAALQTIDDRLRPRQLGEAFARLCDRNVGGLILRKGGTSGGSQRWRVEAVRKREPGEDDA